MKEFATRHNALAAQVQAVFMWKNSRYNGWS
jgi:hypothetical protein